MFHLGNSMSKTSAGGEDGAGIKMHRSLGQKGVKEAGGAAGEQGCVFLPDRRGLRIPAKEF